MLGIKVLKSDSLSLPPVMTGVKLLNVSVDYLVLGLPTCTLILEPELYDCDMKVLSLTSAFKEMVKTLGNPLAFPCAEDVWLSSVNVKLHKMHQ